MGKLDGDKDMIMQKMADSLDLKNTSLKDDLETLRVKKTDWEIGDDIYFVVPANEPLIKPQGTKWFAIKEHLIRDASYSATHLSIAKDSVEFVIETKEGRYPAYVDSDGYQIAESRSFHVAVGSDECRWIDGYIDSGAFPTYEQALQFISRIAYVD